MDRPRRTQRRMMFSTTSESEKLLRTGDKRKAPDVPPTEAQLERLLRNSKSDLTTVDISEIFNASVFSALPEDSQSRLVQLLPRTAFRGFAPSLSPEHPGNREEYTYLPSTMTVLDPSIWTDPHFLAAARTYQDHIYSGWTTKTAEEKVQKYKQGIQNNSFHAPWKDEEWDRSNADDLLPIDTSPSMRSLAGDAAEVKLPELAKGAVIQEGDILAYRRTFSQLGLTIEKDVLVRSIDAKTFSFSVLYEPGCQKALSKPLVRRIGPDDPSPPTLSADVSSPSSLESALLDTDGQVSRAQRPNGNAWKRFTLWRFTGNVETMSDLGFEDERGGRENHGTLFYLRGSFFQER